MICGRLELGSGLWAGLWGALLGAHRVARDSLLHWLCLRPGPQGPHPSAGMPALQFPPCPGCPWLWLQMRLKKEAEARRKQQLQEQEEREEAQLRAYYARQALEGAEGATAAAGAGTAAAPARGKEGGGAARAAGSQAAGAVEPARKPGRASADGGPAPAAAAGGPLAAHPRPGAAAAMETLPTAMVPPLGPAHASPAAALMAQLPQAGMLAGQLPPAYSPYIHPLAMGGMQLPGFSPYLLPVLPAAAAAPSADGSQASDWGSDCKEWARDPAGQSWLQNEKMGQGSPHGCLPIPPTHKGHFYSARRWPVCSRSCRASRRACAWPSSSSQQLSACCRAISCWRAGAKGEGGRGCSCRGTLLMRRSHCRKPAVLALPAMPIPAQTVPHTWLGAHVLPAGSGTQRSSSWSGCSI